jgi:hypothetical protein
MQQGGGNQEVRSPAPPFDEESARQKVKAAQDAWNTRDPQKVSLAYTEDSKWRNRDEFFAGREEIVAFLKRKWGASWTTGWRRTCGASRGTASRSGSSTRAGTPRGNGGAATPTTGLQRACGSSPPRDASRRSSWRWPSGWGRASCSSRCPEGAFLNVRRLPSSGPTGHFGTLPKAAKMPMSATSPEVVERMHHCMPSDS